MNSYIFFGTPDTAALVLRKLIAAGVPPVAVVTNPDKPVGRAHTLTSPPVKEVAISANLPVLQFSTLKTNDALDAIAAYKPEFFVIANYGKIIPPAVLDIVPKGGICVHPSLLPRHRGPSPVQGTILAGDTKTGVTLLLIDNDVDHGPVIASYEMPVSFTDTFSSLMSVLFLKGAEMLIEVLPNFLNGTITPVFQDHTHATFTKKYTTEDGRVFEDDLHRALSGTDHEAAVRIDRMIRALNPEPGVWSQISKLESSAFTIRDKRVKLLAAHIEASRLVLDLIQVEGKKPMPWLLK